ncbi:glutathione S-transferase kappa [Parastagonospora nodorum]|nr:glutathione S-transferase kappa [Parastagonospora nodorum]QRC93544.1 glutathione S-transferase kappa [Parastagonospora nodorum SN15]KAH3932756.1 glutathione S-transferase kappa [Parastagonospora nodorum]KAH3954644.1 glutathione S-transferase kappa [Parastagonospora nodorum]KAH3986469.1 glutathione S-transferase kappa [Parastagonospora nodorum]
MAQPKITLYVDIVSPFAYIAFYILKNSPVFKQCEITYVPIFLGGLMKACGNTPPLHIKNKDKWIDAERLRLCKYFNVPMSQNTPPGFPINTIAIQRALASLEISHPQSMPQAIGLFWENFWVQYNDPMKPENLSAIVRTIVGSEEGAKKVLESTKGEEVKKRLSENTDKALKGGAFGLPWFEATNAKGETEGFWGVDHMGQMCDHLGLERPSGKGWKALL